jgi:hypothetical protein
VTNANGGRGVSFVNELLVLFFIFLRRSRKFFIFDPQTPKPCLA